MCLQRQSRSYEAFMRKVTPRAEAREATRERARMRAMRSSNPNRKKPLRKFRSFFVRSTLYPNMFLDYYSEQPSKLRP